MTAASVAGENTGNFAQFAPLQRARKNMNCGEVTVVSLAAPELQTDNIVRGQVILVE